MANVPTDLIEYLAAVRKAGKYNMMTDVVEIVDSYVNSDDSSPEGINYLFDQQANLIVGNYRVALLEMGKTRG